MVDISVLYPQMSTDIDIISTFDFIFGFQGGFVNGNFEGPGSLMYLVGDYQARYIGKWNNGKMNGNGTYYYIDGRIYKGEWRDGIQVLVMKSICNV